MYCICILALLFRSHFDLKILFLYLQVKSNDTFDDSSDVVQLFRRVAGVDMEIDWVELQNVLNTSFQRGKYYRFFNHQHLDCCTGFVYARSVEILWCSFVVDLIPQLVPSVSSLFASSLESFFWIAIRSCWICIRSRI
jgi:hypothetical protein